MLYHHNYHPSVHLLLRVLTELNHVRSVVFMTSVLSIVGLLFMHGDNDNNNNGDILSLKQLVQRSF